MLQLLCTCYGSIGAHTMGLHAPLAAAVHSQLHGLQNLQIGSSGSLGSEVKVWEPSSDDSMLGSAPLDSNGCDDPMLMLPPALEQSEQFADSVLGNYSGSSGGGLAGAGVGSEDVDMLAGLGGLPPYASSNSNSSSSSSSSISAAAALLQRGAGFPQSAPASGSNSNSASAASREVKATDAKAMDTVSSPRQALAELVPIRSRMMPLPQRAQSTRRMLRTSRSTLAPATVAKVTPVCAAPLVQLSC